MSGQSVVIVRNLVPSTNTAPSPVHVHRGRHRWGRGCLSPVRKGGGTLFSRPWLTDKAWPEVMTSCLHSFIVECFSKLLKWPWMKLNHQSPGNVENRQISFATILVHYTIQAWRNVWGQWEYLNHLSFSYFLLANHESKCFLGHYL